MQAGEFSREPAVISADVEDRRVCRDHRAKALDPLAELAVPQAKLNAGFLDSLPQRARDVVDDLGAGSGLGNGDRIAMLRAGRPGVARFDGPVSG